MFTHTKIIGHKIKEFLSVNDVEFDKREIKTILHKKELDEYCPFYAKTE